MPEPTLTKSTQARLLKVGAWVGGILGAMGVAVLIVVAADHKVQPHGSLDYGDLAVAVGTLMLALVTLASVVLGWQALRDTREEIAISRQEVENAQRPVVMAVYDLSKPVRYPWLGGPIPELGARPRPWDNSLHVPIVNIGAGPALSITLIVTARSPEGTVTLFAGVYSGYIAALAAGDIALVTIPVRGVEDVVPSFDLKIAYTDLAMKGWITTVRWVQNPNDGSDGNYHEPKITAAPFAIGVDPGQALLDMEDVGSMEGEADEGDVF